MAIHIHIRHHPSPCDGTVGQLCGTGEKSFLCFGFGTVWFGSARFGLVWCFPVFQIGNSENLTLNVALVGVFYFCALFLGRGGDCGGVLP